MPRELWAKVAVEIVRDPKLLARAPWERWLWLGLICLTKENANGDGILHGYNPRLLASVLDLPAKPAKVKAALEAFAAAGRSGGGDSFGFQAVSLVPRCYMAGFQRTGKDRRRMDCGIPQPGFARCGTRRTRQGTRYRRADRFARRVPAILVRSG